MKPVSCAVVGVGYLGKFHADKYASIGCCTLTAVVDSDESKAVSIAKRHGCRALTNYKDLLGQVDAVSIAVPTCLHHQVAHDFLAAGIHVLLEKPMTVSVGEAEQLINIARAKKCVLQIGHLERFNAAILALELDEKPLFIESHRLAPFNPRANDVSVVLDLMIHDIDIILELVKSKVDRIDASGLAVLTNDTDIANARIVFESGCVANVTASRVSMKTERKMRMFKPNAYVSVDFQNRVLTCHRRGEKEMFPGVPEIETETSVFDDGDALMEEIQHFIDCIRTGSEPLVTGEAGKRALATAIEITGLLKG